MTNLIPVFEINRSIVKPLPISESFTICHINSPDPNLSLLEYTRRIYNVTKSADFIFVETSFMKDWWDRMPQSLKADVYAVRKSESDFGPFVIKPAEIQLQFLSAAQFSEFRWVV